MQCPDTGGTCFDVDCQLSGCQGDGIRRAMNQHDITGIDQIPVPRMFPHHSITEIKKAA